MLTDLPKELNLLHEEKVGEMSLGVRCSIEMYDMFRKNVGHGSKYLYNMYIYILCICTINCKPLQM